VTVHAGTPSTPGPALSPQQDTGSSSKTDAEQVSLRSRYRSTVSAAANWLGRDAIVLRVLGITLVVFTVLRMVMVAAYADVGSLSLTDWSRVFLAGLRFDLLVGLCFVLPQLLHLTSFSNRAVTGRTSRFLLYAEWLIGFTFLPFLCIAEFLFFEEFESRLNYLAFEYLVYPTEVMTNIWQSYPIVPLLLMLGSIGGGLTWMLRRRSLRELSTPLPWQRRYGILTAALAAIGGLWFSTSQAEMKVTSNRVANECAGNGLYSFVYYAWTCKVDYNQFYPTIDRDQAVAHLRRCVLSKGDQLYSDSAHPLDRTVVTGRPRRNLNVAIILEESLGANFIGVLGDDRGLSPHFDKVSKEGVLLDNFYATGNRTARALEAVTTSLPPIPTESILKRDHSQHVFTLANVLAKRNYERVFLYGGRGLFDGMRSFMIANGYNRFIEEHDFENPTFANAWGVSDEDLLRRGIEEMDRLHAAGRPFLTTFMTVSNHRPYTYPAGRIPQTGQSRLNAVRYADWAIGDFFRRAKSHPFYKDTIFVVLGDHGARVYGSQLFPMKSYRVAALMILPNGERRGTRCSTLGCSMDLAPTIMGLLGGSYRSVFFGRDVLNLDPKKGYALMQHNHDVALLDASNHLTVLGMSKSVSNFQFDPKTFRLNPVTIGNAKHTADTISFFQLANRLYYDEQCYPAVR